MPTHPTFLPRSIAPSPIVTATTVRPDPTRHIVARAQQQIRQMRAPADLPHRVIMAGQHHDGPLRRGADVEGADEPVDAGGGDGAGPVFVPVVREGLGGRRGGGVGHGGGFVEGWGWWGMDGDGEGEVVGGGGRGAQVEDAQVRVGRDGGEDRGRVWREGGAVRAGVRWEREEGVGALGRPLCSRERSELWVRVFCSGTDGGAGGRAYDLDGAVPRAGADCVFRHQVPVDGEDFPLVLLPGAHGEVVEADVE